MKIECRSYAKINWTLEVLGKRPDGFHELRTILQTIDLYDTLVFERTDHQIELTCDNPTLPTDEHNLVYRAAVRLREATGVKDGVHVSIMKRIPIGGGLGGGSSNAAVTLLALQQVWQCRLQPPVLLSLGGSIGSDVPGFFYGGTVLGVGRGAEVYPLSEIETPHILLVTPPFQVSTRDAYGDLNIRLTTPDLLANIPDCCSVVYRTSELVNDSAHSVTWNQGTRNDLEAVVIARYPEIGRIIGRLRELGATAVRMSGSGSTVFAVFEKQEMIENAVAQTATEPWHVIRTRTIDRKEYWERLMKEESHTESSIFWRECF